MYRRQLLVAVSGGGSAIAVAGCLDDQTSSDQEGRTADRSEGTNDDSKDGPDEDQTGEDADETEDEEEEECRTEVESRSETVVDRSRNVDGGYEWTHGYRCEDGDTVHFDVSASDGQDIEVEIDSPRGRTVYSESGLSVSTTQEFDTGGSGEVRVTNLGERTEEEREKLWDDRENVGAGNQLGPWTEIREGNRVDYYVRMVDGARPKLRIENSAGDVHREHSVSEVIDDSFTAPEDDRYYFFVENTALMTSGTWDYTFERAEDVPISTTAELSVEREYEEEIEVCD